MIFYDVGNILLDILLKLVLRRKKILHKVNSLIKIKENVKKTKHVAEVSKIKEEQLIKLLASRACANLKYSFKTTPLSHNKNKKL